MRQSTNAQPTTAGQKLANREQTECTAQRKADLEGGGPNPRPDLSLQTMFQLSCWLSSESFLLDHRALPTPQGLMIWNYVLVDAKDTSTIRPMAAKGTLRSRITPMA